MDLAGACSGLVFSCFAGKGPVVTLSNSCLSGSMVTTLETCDGPWTAQHARQGHLI